MDANIRNTRSTIAYILSPLTRYGKRSLAVVPELTVATPQDEAERLELQHRVFHKIFDSRLIFPPVPRFQRVLDCGYGAGTWAIEVAEQYPSCEVIQPTSPSPSSTANRLAHEGNRSRYIPPYEA